LGVLIAKFKLLSGMPHHVYKKLYDSMVLPDIAYGAAIRRTMIFSCIEAVGNHAMRFVLGTGKYTPSSAVAGEIGWDQVYVKQLKCVGNFWCKLSNMGQNSVNFKISKYLESRNCSNWHCRIKNLFIKFGCVDFSDCTLPLNKNLVVDTIVKNAMDVLIDEWIRSVHCILS
jgi:hypothetical protein